MLNITPYGKFKGVGKNKRKTQIILCHTSREVKDYLTSLTFRYNSKYNKIPHFVITRDDKVLQLLPEHSYSHFMWDENLNKKFDNCDDRESWLDGKETTFQLSP